MSYEAPPDPGATPAGGPGDAEVRPPRGQLLALLLRRATGSLIFLNVLAFVAISIAGGSPVATTEGPWLVGMGAKHNPSIAAGESWRLIACCFLHIGFLHLVVNMFALLNLGLVLEALIGTPLFLATYALSGACGSLASYAASDKISAGASGAIFGLGGALLALGYLAPERVPPPLRAHAGRGMLPFVVLNGIIGGLAYRYIDNWAHGGGLVGGMAISGLLVFLVRWPAAFRVAERVLGLAAFATLAAGLGLALRHVPVGLELVETATIATDVLPGFAEINKHIETIDKISKNDSGRLSAAEARRVRDAGLALARLRAGIRARLAALRRPFRDPTNARLIAALEAESAELSEIEKRLRAIPADQLPAAMARELAEHAPDWHTLQFQTSIPALNAWVSSHQKSEL